MSGLRLGPPTVGPPMTDSVRRPAATLRRVGGRPLPPGAEPDGAPAPGRRPETVQHSAPPGPVEEVHAVVDDVEGTAGRDAAPPSRRTLLRLAGLAGVAGGAAALAGCGEAVSQAAEGFRLRQDVADRPDDELLVTVWGGPEEEAAFRALGDSFVAAHGGSVVWQVVPFSQALTTVDTGLRTGAAPDVFRVTYSDVGPYRAQDVLASLPADVAARLAPQFGSSFWSAVTDDAASYGVPHHTDTTMVLVNDDALAAAGVRPPEPTPEAAWTWDEALDAMRRVRDTAGPVRSAVAVNWQLAGASRWLSWVGQAGGRLLREDLEGAVAADDPALLAAMGVTRDLFRDGLTPRSMSTKSGQYTDGLFTSQQVAMAHVGNFTLPTVETSFPWTATFLPVQERATADLGGNALVATRGPREERALAFLEHCVGAEQQASFCAAASALPTRGDVDVADIPYRLLPEVLALYAQQAEAVTTDVVDQVTVPQATGLNRVLVEQLEVAFLGGDELSDARACEDLVAAVDAELAR